MDQKTLDIAIIAGELSWGPSSSQEGERKHQGENPPWEQGHGQGFPSLKGGFKWGLEESGPVKNCPAQCPSG